ncbi:MAG: hypothetical protein AAGD38_19625, partial [Acidobacteriota bacterium]
MTKRVLAFLVGALLIVPSLYGDNGDLATLQETFRQQLEADRERLYEMSREERHAYISEHLGSDSPEERFAFKRALEVFRSESDLSSLNQEQRPVVNDRPGALAARAAGTNITYDTGVNAVGPGGADSFMVGNRFDTGLGFPVEDTGTITMITFNIVNTFNDVAIWSLYSNIMGTTANRVTTMSRAVAPGFNTLSVASPTTMNVYMNETFLAGIWQLDPASSGLALDTATVAGQGFHGISINDNTPMGGPGGFSYNDNLTVMGAQVNVVFRVSGNVVLPVE